ncbi:hypothetical protein BV25DRAFT_1817668 [Artomyces pyxidatus]|uniref:Uncharacterized protein n=1 Tax=Artomyces pyxidatus TaxID=48021 RepID=A0ACB8TK07_9AGAM|nr:hypothetical protein BV25DRAFT_1817668 [Artomyces pyxidatus]
MAPAPAAAAALFHPSKKRKAPVDKGSPSGSLSPKKPRPIAKPSPKPEPAREDPPFSLPDGPFTEFKLVSSALNGWKYDVMKFDSHKPVDILSWPAPVKLNRKDVRRAEASANGEGNPVKAVGPLLGQDGKPVIGADGRIVMQDAEGKPIHPESSASGSGKGKPGAAGAKKKFGKKTRQIHIVPEEKRQMRREERYPWVMEDASGAEVWIGDMQEERNREYYAFFMPASNNTFKFVPAHRWYKFHKKPSYHIPDLEEAEQLMAMRQRNKDPERWLLRKRNGQGPSAATSAILKSEPDAEHATGQSLGPGGRRLRTVASDSRGLFGDDDDEDGGRSRKRGSGADAEYDEVPSDEEPQDDDEGEVTYEDELEKELNKQLNEKKMKELLAADKQRDGRADVGDDDDEEGDTKLTGAAKAMKKLVNKLDKNDAYDSDDEGNPYASSEEEEEEEVVVADGPAVQSQMTIARGNSQTPSQIAIPQVPAGTAAPRPVPTSAANSRATSPLPNHGGHSIVAKRATSPKVPKPKGLVAPGRATSPLAQVAAQSPQLSSGGGDVRATSPAATSPRLPPGTLSNGQSSTIPPKKPSAKRKATDDADAPSTTSPTSPLAGAPPKAKKRKGPPPALDEHGNPIYFKDSDVIEWLQKTPTANTRDCIMYFTPYLHDNAEKSKFTALIKEVAQLKNGVLVLRSQYRTGGEDGEGASPTAVSK